MRIVVHLNRDHELIGFLGDLEATRTDTPGVY
jgi:hypothetical protein